MRPWQILQDDLAEKQAFYYCGYQNFTTGKHWKSGVFVSYGCYVKVPKPGWLKTVKLLITSQFWKLEIQNKCVCRAMLPLKSMEESVIAFSQHLAFAGKLRQMHHSNPQSSHSALTVCLHIVFPLCVSVFVSRYLLFIRATNIALQPILMTSF